jgi:hypothetical protein
MMTKDPKKDTGCETPIPDTTFYSNSKAAYLWMLWDNASKTDEMESKWYKPNGDLFVEYSDEATYSSGCWYPGINIRDYASASNLGEWRIDVYFKGIKRFSEYFTIITAGEYCPTEKIYGEDSEEIKLLRSFRDNVLNKTPEGQEIIRLYYEWSPIIVKALEEDEDFKAQVKGMINGILPLIMGEVE